MASGARKSDALDKLRKGDRRTYGRRRQEFLESSLGPVLDLSLGGARILTRKAPEGEVDILIKSISGDLSLHAEVRWVKRVGFRRFEIGLMFHQVSTLAAQRLAEISTQHRLWYDESA
jgi:hypothetical protein